MLTLVLRSIFPEHISTMGLSGVPSLWIFEPPWMRRTFSEVGYKNCLSSFLILPCFSMSCSMETRYFLSLEVGSLSSLTYVLVSLSKAYILLSYSDLSNTTVALPLSAPNTMMESSSWSCWIAWRSSWLMFEGGGFADLRAKLICFRFVQFPTCFFTCSNTIVHNRRLTNLIETHSISQTTRQQLNTAPLDLILKDFVYFLKKSIQGIWLEMF